MGPRRVVFGTGNRFPVERRPCMVGPGRAAFGTGNRPPLVAWVLAQGQKVVDPKTENGTHLFPVTTAPLGT